MFSSNAPWPPPPDLDSLKELFAAADIEGFISTHGAPTDEYDTEAEALLTSLSSLTTESLTVSKLMPILNRIWQTNFNVYEDDLEQRQPALHALAKQIARFFGPEAQPQVRS